MDYYHSIPSDNAFDKDIERIDTTMQRKLAEPFSGKQICTMQHRKKILKCVSENMKNALARWTGMVRYNYTTQIGY